MNEEWFLQLTLEELKCVEGQLLDGDSYPELDSALEKVQAAIQQAENWHTPVSEVVGTPSRGELPDA